MSLFKKKPRPNKPKEGDLRAKIKWDPNYKGGGHVWIYTKDSGYRVSDWTLWSLYAKDRGWYKFPSTTVVDMPSEESARNALCMRMERAREFMSNPTAPPTVQRPIIYEGEC